MPHDPPKPWRRLGVLLFAVLAAYAVAGFAYGTLNIGDVPPYGDTRLNLRLARNGRTDPFRGILYPKVIRMADGWHGGESFLPAYGDWEESDTGEHLEGLWVLQVVQVLVGVASLGWFLWVAGRVGLLPRGRLAAWLLGALLLLDPMVLHYLVAIMTDGPALAMSLVFLAACAGLVTRRTPAVPTWIVLVLSQVALITLRVEKNWVVLGTVVASFALWALPSRFAEGARAAVPPRRFAAVAGVCLVGFVAFVVGSKSLEEDSKPRWPLATQLLHQRVVFRNIERLYDELPEDLRARISREDAHEHDVGISEARRTLRRITREDDAAVVALVDELSAEALRRRGGWILLDVVRDTIENVFATFSFYGHLPGAVLSDPQTENWIHDWRTDNTAKIYARYAFHHPRAAAVHLILGASVTLGALLLVLVSRRGRRAEADRWGPAQWAAVTPAAVFVILNAGVFAATQDLTQIRYGIVAHALFLFLVYSAAIRSVRGAAADGST